MNTWFLIVSTVLVAAFTIKCMERAAQSANAERGASSMEGGSKQQASKNTFLFVFAYMINQGIYKSTSAANKDPGFGFPCCRRYSIGHAQRDILPHRSLRGSACMGHLCQQNPASFHRYIPAWLACRCGRSYSRELFGDRSSETPKELHVRSHTFGNSCAKPIRIERDILLHLRLRHLADKMNGIFFFVFGK